MEIPMDIGNISKIAILALNNNKLTGTIPLSVQKLEKLETLQLEENLLIGEIPDWNSTQKTLQILDLSKNQLEGMLPQWLAEMDISFIMLSDNNLTCSLPPRKVPESITNIYGLMLLDLSNNKFSSNTLPDFSSNVNLQIIDFSSNEFSGEIPTSFSHLIRILSLGKNKFFGRLSRNLTNMSTLKHLDIHDNKIIGELLDICQISTLKILNLRNNSLQGSIPDCISNLTSLQILDLSSNHLVGEITVKFGNLAGMISIETPGGFSYFSAILIPTLAIQTKINDVIVNWKKSKQGLSWNNLKIYSLLDLSMNQISEDLPPTKPPEVKSKETWFSWEGVGIGYAIGFFVAVGILYISGYFVPAKPPNYRRQQRRQRI
ncbi:receptor-like protein 12 [Fagus crenata]